MWTRAIVLLMTTGCGRIAFDDLTPGDARFRKPIEVTPSSVALSDFVVAVSTPADADLAAHVRPEGDDLVVTAADGSTVLDHELERFDPTTGELAAWVRVPRLEETTLYLYYGGPGATADRSADTWSPATYAAVWHLSGDPSTARDSSVGGHELLALTTSAHPSTGPGRSGEAQVYDGVDDQLRITDVTDRPLRDGASSFSYSVWVRVTQSAGTYDMPMYCGGASAGNAGYDLELGTADWYANVGDGTANLSVRFGPESEFLGSWVQLVAVVDRAANTLSTYANGGLRSSRDITALGSVDNPAIPFRFSYAMYPFRGQLDEPRVYPRALEPEWIDAEFRNLSAPASFASIGAEEELP